MTGGTCGDAAVVSFQEKLSMGQLKVGTESRQLFLSLDGRNARNALTLYQANHYPTISESAPSQGPPDSQRQVRAKTLSAVCM